MRHAVGGGILQSAIDHIPGLLFVCVFVVFVSVFVFGSITEGFIADVFASAPVLQGKVAISGEQLQRSDLNIFFSQRLKLPLLQGLRLLYDSLSFVLRPTVWVIKSHALKSRSQVISANSFGHGCKI